MAACIHCEKTDQQVPLLQLVYRGKEVFICQLVLIHKPEMLPGMKAEKMDCARYFL